MSFFVVTLAKIVFFDDSDKFSPQKLTIFIG